MGSLVPKLAEIYLAVDRFAKTKQVTGGGAKFKYTPVEEIADELREAMGKRGIVMVPEEIEVIASGEAGVTSNGNTRWRHILRVVWNITDGTDSLRVSSVGEAIDTSDKGANKAQTAARKYALIGAFQLSTGDDPDARHPEPIAQRSARRNDYYEPPQTDPKARARQLMDLAGDKDALVAALAAAGIRSADLADEATWAKAWEIAAKVRTAAGGETAGPKPSDPPPARAPRSADPDTGEDGTRYSEGEIEGQAKLGSSL